MGDPAGTNWTPPAVPGGPAPTTPTPAATDPTSDWSWFSSDQLSSVGAWGEWFSNLPHEFQQAFSVFSETPEQQLADAIYKKMGPSRTPRLPHGPDPNMVVAQSAAHAAMTNPSYREQLSQSLGWNQKNPTVVNWINKGGAMPQDPTGTGVAPGQTAPGGTTTTPSTTSAIAGAPFDPKAWVGRAKDPGFTYGAVLPPSIAAAAGVPNQWGVDYALPLGTKLTSPFSGTVQEADFNGPYGNTVVVKMANGLTYRVAHLESLNVKVGDPVPVGALLGLVGSTGNSTGPHVLIEMNDSQGRHIDPTMIIDNLLKGDYTGASKVSGDFATASAANAPGGGNFVLTSDGHGMYPGSQDYQVFFAAQQLWRKRYGVDPPWSFVSSLIASGQTTVEQVTNAMDLMTSDIANMNWGQRDQLTTDANAAATKTWSRPLPDATIKQLAAEGITTPGQINGWVLSHPASAVSNADYTAIFDELAPSTQKYWEQPPSPEMVLAIHKKIQQGPQ